MKLSDLFERVETLMRTPATDQYYVDLYFGGCLGLAQSLDERGFKPSTIGRKFLYLYTTEEGAKQAAARESCDSLLLVKNVPVHILHVDFSTDRDSRDIMHAVERIKSGESFRVKLAGELSPTNFVFMNKTQKQFWVN